MKTINCDRCGKKIDDNTLVNVTTRVKLFLCRTISLDYDLCGDCRRALKKWFAGNKKI